MITESVQDDEPPQFCGGIIADPMGLGKTLTMIALVSTDAEKRNEELGLPKTSNYVGATLIVVPPPCKLAVVAFNVPKLTKNSTEFMGRTNLGVSKNMLILKGQFTN